MTPVQRLRIGRTVLEYQIEDVVNRLDIPEIFIDGRSLAQWLGLSRNLGNCDSDFHDSASPDERKRLLSTFLGDERPLNQFDSGRIVLYRCHCGCDECGVISCRLAFCDDRVVWQDLTYEDADGPMLAASPGQSPEASLLPPGAPLRFVFDRVQYQTELERHYAP